MVLVLIECFWNAFWDFQGCTCTCRLHSTFSLPILKAYQFILLKHMQEENRKRKDIQSCFIDSCIRWSVNIDPLNKKRGSEKPPCRYNSLLCVYQNEHIIIYTNTKGTVVADSLTGGAINLLNSKG